MFFTVSLQRRTDERRIDRSADFFAAGRSQMKRDRIRSPQADKLATIEFTVQDSE
jgi:hypothetical protein